MANASTPKKRPGFSFKKLLGRRVNVPAGKVLGRDVHTPKPVKAVGGYFKGSWDELRQVKWPTRRATWAMTLAVILFTWVMAGFILALDYGFEQLFKQVIL